MFRNCSAICMNLALCAMLGLSFLIVQTKSDNDRLVNYIATADLPDGEHETRMRFGDVIVREASVSEQNENGIRRGLMLRQIASGPHLLQLIHKLSDGKAGAKKNRLIECEVMNDWGAANQFRTHFQKELTRSGLSLHVPMNRMNSSEQEDDLASYDDFDLDHSESPRGDIIDLDQQMEDFRNVTVRMLRNDEVIGDLQRSFDIIAQQRLCKRLHRKMKRAIAENDVSKLDSLRNYGEQSLRRVRREFRGFVPGHLGILPGTLWCGDGSLADKYQSMGAHVGTDRCCREHDSCLFVITAMTSAYGVFNYRMHTLSHCTCDESFRSCLKQTNTGAANFVGKLYFNVVQTKCFVLKPERSCVKQSWWGKCLKYEYKKQAYLREPLPY